MSVRFVSSVGGVQPELLVRIPLEDPEQRVDGLPVHTEATLRMKVVVVLQRTHRELTFIPSSES